MTEREHCTLEKIVFETSKKIQHPRRAAIAKPLIIESNAQRRIRRCHDHET
jgi:hypothetical protein